jgi:hypothetical protein
MDKNGQKLAVNHTVFPILAFSLPEPAPIVLIMSGIIRCVESVHRMSHCGTPLASMEVYPAREY